jgi:hypothetical protein
MSFQTIKEYFTYFVGIFGIYLIWICLHYISAHLYIWYCVPATVVGFIMAPFIAPAPHCQALRWAIYNGGNSMVAMWFLLGTWFMRYLVPVKN